MIDSNHSHFGLDIQTPARQVRAHPSPMCPEASSGYPDFTSGYIGKRKRSVSSRPDQTPTNPNRQDIRDVSTHPEDTRRLR